MDHEKKKDILDDFWDIDKLLPQKKKPATFRAHTYDTNPVEVIFTAKESTSYEKLTTIEMRPSDPAQSKLTFASHPEKDPEPDDEYTPENPFIKTVKIFKRNDFCYYSAFYEDGMRYLGISGSECHEPSFFSWVPQYSQLDAEQLGFYFYMRSELRQGRMINASYSYILLYIFELINVEPRKEYALSQLSFMWRSYRAKYPKLDPLMKEWITDYCFINHLAPSADELGEAFNTALESAAVRELFICAHKSDEDAFHGEGLAKALLELCTNYDWRKSKFATSENIPLYEKHVKGALRAVLAAFRGKQGIFVGSGELKRDAFSGALCTPSVKCRIEVRYCSIARSHEMRFLITDVIKHIENRIRAYVGVKSRLTIYSLPVDVRKCIDEYMDNNLPGKRARKKEEHHEYDRLYDVPKREFSLENAKLIEEESWKTTQILVEAFEDDITQDSVTDKTAAAHLPISDNYSESISDEERLFSALSPYMDFIFAALNKDSEKQAEISREKGRMTDALADEINEISADVFGDIILQKDGNVYTVIEDYAEVFENAGNK